jgi:hypothetical protein
VSCRVSAVTSVSATVASDQAGPTSRGARGARRFDCHAATMARGEQEDTRHPGFPMLKMLLVLKPKNIVYTTSGVYGDKLLST